MKGCLWLNQLASPGIFNQFHKLIIKMYQIFIAAPLPRSVKKSIFAKLLDEPVDLLEKQVSPDKHSVDFLIC